jgi:hypothetical protein
MHFRIDADKLSEALAQFAEIQQTQFAEIQQTSLRKSSKLDCGKAANKFAEKRQTIKGTETTSEITSENTAESVCGAVAPSAVADTHTGSLSLSEEKKDASRSPKAKKREKTRAGAAGDFPELTAKQMCVYRILTIYFPGLGTKSNRAEFAQCLREFKISPFAGPPRTLSPTN